MNGNINNGRILSAKKEEGTDTSGSMDAALTYYAGPKKWDRKSTYYITALTLCPRTDKVNRKLISGFLGLE